MVSIFFGILFFFVAFLIVSLVLLQESKGGGLAAMGGAQMDSVMGVRNPLRRWTAYFAIAFAVLAIFINWSIANRGEDDVPEGVEALPAVTQPAGPGEAPAQPPLRQPGSVPAGGGVLAPPPPAEMPGPAEAETDETAAPADQPEKAEPADASAASAAAGEPPAAPAAEKEAPAPAADETKPEAGEAKTE